jgi:ATP-binding protein involved in chromosome partitioning
MNTLNERVTSALSKVIDPELRMPITELGMVGEITGSDDSPIVEIKLTVSHCPQSDYLEQESSKALKEVFPNGQVKLSVMTKAELDELKLKLRGPQKQNPFGPGSSTRVILVGSGKGGVGKSTITANLAVSLAKSGYQVGLVDADIFGFSITQQLGITDRPTRLDDMMLPPIAHGVKVISIGMFLAGNEPVSWRGPMLHKAIEQFLTDVYWGSLDFLLVDMPPGTGDVAISIGQLLPNAKALVLTTAAQAAAIVSVRSGLAASKAGHELIGVVENMSWLETNGKKEPIFGSGGGLSVSQELTAATGKEVKLLAQIPISSELSAGSDAGSPLVLANPDEPAALVINELAKTIAPTKLGKDSLTLNVKLTS